MSDDDIESALFADPHGNAGHHEGDIARQQMREPIMTPGAVIRHLLDTMGISQTEAARRLNVSRPTFAHMLAGRARLSLDMAARLEETFGMSGYALSRLQFEIDARERLPR